ncbi:mitochondrial inner membrane protease subunit 2 [Venturia canescens]|uniref:mitochondrial inner membrane protease subunit 2 n=1 Tax=Venturia canescens TaxID=32260 RepID=UPI001C9BD0E6|nr:mitochondrial inner membrane protease subunit 2 [Venturia canescens]XP_043280604.1 mitochondrial inner membrane protease subunit 2 [Venturia canescens]XP_043280605.1 mitochondrial inner membrane protease subunit 2 [Venturia canescens]XP_043280606.1 mitochondrial inner membrane protease subunit 2 [Venturia canescens]
MGLSPLFRNILLGVPIGVTFLDTVGYVARVEGISMQPALNPDDKQTDWVFLNRWAVRSYDVQYGDVVIFVSPKFPSQKLIKRIIGLSGDIVATIGYKSPVVEVPEGHCWVEGDHTGHSMDSNCFGPVSLGLVTAKATCIVWPPSRWQYLKSTVPENRKPINFVKSTLV